MSRKKTRAAKQTAQQTQIKRQLRQELQARRTQKQAPVIRGFRFIP